MFLKNNIFEEMLHVRSSLIKEQREIKLMWRTIKDVIKKIGVNVFYPFMVKVPHVEPSAFY